MGSRVVVVPPPIKPLLFPDALREAAREFNRDSKVFFQALSDGSGGVRASRLEFLRALRDPAELRRSRRRALREVSRALLGGESAEDALFCDTLLRGLRIGESSRKSARRALLSFARWRRARLALAKCEALLLRGVETGPPSASSRGQEDESEQAAAAATAASAAAALVLSPETEDQRTRFLRALPTVKEERKPAPRWDCELDAALRTFVLRSQHRLDSAAREARKAMPAAARADAEGKGSDKLGAVCRKLESWSPSNDWNEVVASAEKVRQRRRRCAYAAVAGDDLPALINSVAEAMEQGGPGRLPRDALRAMRALHSAFATDGRKLRSVVQRS